MTTSVALSPVAILQFFDNTGKPAVGGSLLTQSGGGNYATYSDPLGATPLPNPIPLNSRGEVSTAAGASSELFLQTGVAYTFTLKDSAGNQLWSIGNITSSNPGVAVNFPTASGSANAQIITNPVPISVGKGTIQWFLPVAANTGATTVNDDNNGATSVLYLTKALIGGEFQVGVPAQIINDGTNWNLVNSARGPVTDYYVDSGAVNAVAITANIAQTTYANLIGAKFKIKASNTTTTAAATLNINGIGATLNLVYGSDNLTALAAGAWISGNFYDVLISSATTAEVLNPSRVASSFTITLTGMTAGTTGTINYVINPDGKTAFVWAAAAISGTSNTTAMTGTGIPAALTTTTNKQVFCLVKDNGANNIGVIGTGTSTTWTFGNNPVGAFTNVNAKGLQIFQSQFTLD